MFDANAQRQLNTQLRGMLAPGEEVRWSAPPDAAAYRATHAKSPWITVPLMVLGFGSPIAAFMYGARSDPFVWGMSLTWAVIGVVGVMLFLSPRAAEKRAQRMLYAITGRRALILMVNAKPGALALEGLESITVIERPDGSGDLILRHDDEEEKVAGPRLQRDRFAGLPNVREVAALLRRTAGGEATPAPVAPDALRVPPGASAQARALSTRLDQDERIVWTGTPSRGYKRRDVSLQRTYIAVWTAIALGMSAGAYAESGKFGVIQWALLPFWVAPLLALSRTAHAGKAYLRTIYAITDRRAIVAEFDGVTTIRTFFPKRLHKTQRESGKNGLESLVMRTDWQSGSDNNYYERAGFLDMEDADDAVNAYRRLRDGGTPEARA